MLTKRSSGILMHPTSLPSRGGIGDLGPAAYEFVNWLVAAKQTLWQILPFGPVGYGNSPYSSTSAFAGNVLMISLERLVQRGYLDPSRTVEVPDAEPQVDFENTRALKLPLLREAARNFLLLAQERPRERYRAFCAENQWWLDDYALFSVLREHFGDNPWNSWPEEIARREPEALLQLGSDLKDQLELERFLQFAFFEQWKALRAYCADRGIRIVGDVAIFVSYDSADVWTHPDIFRLNEDLVPEVVAGVPPDAFSETGQRWGNPLYNWGILKSRGYDWWVQAGNPVETTERLPEPVEAFGASIPVRPEVIVDIAEAKEIIADPEGAALVSVRTWREHIGQVSGYNYIGPAGRIKGDVWGNCGSDAYHMQHYRNVDNTMREYPEITANWAEAGITADKWVAFYCGTGWRASETWFYAYLQGWERIAVYDGGWFEWSADPEHNPIEIGLPADGGPAAPRTYVNPVVLPTPAIAPA